MRALSQLPWWIAGAFSALVLGVPACGSGSSGGSTETTGAASCTAGQTATCACPGNVQGVQQCQADGTFAACQCDGSGSGGEGAGGPLASCGDGKVDKSSGEECDDGNKKDDDSCTNKCKKPVCGDGIVQAPESCDDAGAQGEVSTCPDDCGCPEGGCGTGGGGGAGGAGGAGPTASSTSTGTGGKCDPGQLLYAGNVPNVGPVWEANGLSGLDAGDAMCKGIGASHVCDYEEVLAAQVRGELAAIPAGTTAWIHRTTDAIVGEKVSKPGAGGRCNDWKYATNHIADGEYADFQAAGVPTYNLDPDTVFDGANPGVHVQPGLDCGGAKRAILCCFPVPQECWKP